jgi:dTDP-glucose 4,6-dehydratase
VGPHLPLDAHFAIGNFIRDALAGGPIRVNGDGTPYRSYLYAADLAEWLFTILLRGRAGRAYNVGSEEALSVLELAERVAETIGLQGNGGINVTVAKKPIAGTLAVRYVPAASRAHAELELEPSVPLSRAIARAAHWAAPER